MKKHSAQRGFRTCPMSHRQIASEAGENPGFGPWLFLTVINMLDLRQGSEGDTNQPPPPPPQHPCPSPSQVGQQSPLAGKGHCAGAQTLGSQRTLPSQQRQTWHLAVGEGKRSPLVNSFPWYWQPKGQGRGWGALEAVHQAHNLPGPADWVGTPTFLVRTPTWEGQARRKGVALHLGLEKGGLRVRGRPRR